MIICFDRRVGENVQTIGQMVPKESMLIVHWFGSPFLVLYC